MLLNYAHYTNLAGALDVLNKIRQFAVGQGWVQEEWRYQQEWYEDPGVVTDGSWAADSISGYLCLSSTGYGTQALIAKLQVYRKDRVAGNPPMMNVVMCSSPSYTYAGNKGNFPYAQNNLTHAPPQYYQDVNGWSVGNSVDELYLFGNDKYIAAVAIVNGIYCTMLHFGAMEIFENNPSQGFFAGHQVVYATTGSPVPHQWYSYNDVSISQLYVAPAFITSGTLLAQSGSYFDCSFDIYYESISKFTNSNTATRIRWSMEPSLWKFNGSSIKDPLLDLWPVCKLNGFSGKRVMLKMIYYHLRQADSVIEPLLRSPYYILNAAGLTPGQTLRYGKELYKIFPMYDFSHTPGIAFRIQ